MGPSHCPGALQQTYYGDRIRGIFEIVERYFRCQVFETSLGEGDMEMSARNLWTSSYGGIKKSSTQDCKSLNIFLRYNNFMFDLHKKYFVSNLFLFLCVGWRWAVKTI
jgi:hypothetical protein